MASIVLPIPPEVCTQADILAAFQRKKDFRAQLVALCLWRLRGAVRESGVAVTVTIVHDQHLAREVLVSRFKQG